MQHLSASPILAPLGFLAFFVTLWLCVCALLAHLSGWRSLSTLFRANAGVGGEEFRFCSGSMGSSNWFPVGYRNCLCVTVSEPGLGLSVLFLFRVFSPALFIPWEKVESVEEGRVWLVRCAMVRIRGMSTRIGLQGKSGESAMAAYSRFEQRRRLQRA